VGKPDESMVDIIHTGVGFVRLAGDEAFCRKGDDGPEGKNAFPRPVAIGEDDGGDEKRGR
jgi:hypothetical protein